MDAVAVILDAMETGTHAGEPGHSMANAQSLYELLKLRLRGRWETASIGKKMSAENALKHFESAPGAGRERLAEVLSDGKIGEDLELLLLARTLLDLSASSGNSLCLGPVGEVGGDMTVAGNNVFQIRYEAAHDKQAPTSKDRVRELVTHARERLRYQVGADRSSEFFQKFVRDVYFPRQGTEDKLRKFIRQSEYRCFVVVGPAGTGKTNLLCRFAQILQDERDSFVPLLLASTDLDLDLQSIEQAILDQANAGVEEGNRNHGIEHLSSLLEVENAHLIVILDAINEMVGTNAFQRFNRQFDRLLGQVLALDAPIFFVLSCRQEPWSQFGSSFWVNDQVWRPEGSRPGSAGRATHLLKNFDESEVDSVIERYFAWYAIEGRLLGTARRNCCDPLMLRYLCAAYTRRSPGDKVTPADEIEPFKLGVLSSLRRKEAFDHFVENRTEHMASAALAALGSRDDDLVYETTTRYLITVAYAMYLKKRPYIKVEEVIQVARDLGHPDRLLADKSAHHFLSDPRSVFFRLVDEGVILSKRDRDTYSFVFEAYFEFSLGRYIVLHRWPDLSGGEIDPERIEEDFELLLREHEKLSEEDTFNNLFGAMQFALLVVDQPRKRTRQERLYGRHPDLFLKLVRRMSRTSTRGLDWIQQALSSIRESHFTDVEVWRREESAAAGQALKEGFDQVLEILEGLTNATDFVVLWDLTLTIEKLADARSDKVLAELERWSRSGTILQAFFATLGLVRLSFRYPREVTKILFSLSEQPRFRESFWLARSLILAIGELLRRDEGHLDPGDRCRLLDVLRTFAEGSGEGAIRALALSALAFLAEGERLEWVERRLVDESWPWAGFNLVLGLRDLQWKESQTQSIRQILRRLASEGHPHTLYAIDRLLLSERGTDLRSDELQEKLRGNRWRAGSSSGRSGRQHSELPGIAYTPAYLLPDYDNHIECRERLEAVVQRLGEALPDRFNWIDPWMADENQLSWAHSEWIDRHRDRAPWPRYIEEVREAGKLCGSPSMVRDQGSGPSELRFESYDAARLSVGGVLAAIDYVLDGPAPVALALNRPPGHLANNTICIFNNVAIGAHYAKDHYAIERILILDCDAHQGLHTYRVFRGATDVVYFSIHVDGDYATEAGLVEHTGEGEGAGFTFNLNYPKGMRDPGYRAVVDHLLLPVLDQFSPELVLISAGFDGHFDDPLTPGCDLTERAYIHLARALSDWARPRGVKIAGGLEGGYGLDGMASSFVHMLNILGGLDIPPEEIGLVPLPEGFDPEEDPTLSLVHAQIRRRIEAVAEFRSKQPDHLFDPSHPTWKRILEKTP